MTMAPKRPANGRQALAELQAAVGSVARPNPLVLAWRWRYELILTAAIAAGGIALARTPASIWMLAGCTAPITIAASWPSVGRLLVAWAWCVITPHRVRAGCAGAWIHSRGGRLPAVLLTRRQPFGERVYLWCRAGTCRQDFEAARELLTAACWAQDIRSSSDPRNAQLVTLDVIRDATKVPGAPTASQRTARAAVAAPDLLARLRPLITVGVVILLAGALTGGLIAAVAPL
jgi:hypothetical protein